MTKTQRSLVRHVLTAIGTVIALLGINAWIPVIDFLKENLDPVWDAVTLLVGFAITFYGFIVNRKADETETTE